MEKNTARAIGEAKPLLAALPDLLLKLGSLQGGEILTGDYDLKLRRQNYFTRKQDQVMRNFRGERHTHTYTLRQSGVQIMANGNSS